MTNLQEPDQDSPEKMYVVTCTYVTLVGTYGRNGYAERLCAAHKSRGRCLVTSMLIIIIIIIFLNALYR